MTNWCEVGVGWREGFVPVLRSMASTLMVMYRVKKPKHWATPTVWSVKHELIIILVKLIYVDIHIYNCLVH